ncbi:unnamed protein product [Dibothriocephalus latus]|uniref:Uncharacterized protein n=1 Tax=Dibothriocephalus latus TaxID=60516 RepID=A0A3P7MM75_DIBLA|nr:unnamed protein product [Dibothriocephalus latus]
MERSNDAPPLATGTGEGGLQVPFCEAAAHRNSAKTEEQQPDLAVETVDLLLLSKYDETENRLGHAQILQLVKY